MLLAIDTSTSWISLALFDGTFIHDELTWESQHHHTVELSPAVKQIFRQTGTTPKMLTGIAVATGPGSFTSLRIGLSLAKGFALALNLPIVGVPSLDIIAASQPVEELPMIAVLHAGRKRLAFVPYKAVGRRWEAQAEPAVIDPKDLVKTITEPTLVCGELSEEDRSIIGRRWKNAIIASPAHSLRRAGFLAEIGWNKLMQNQADDPRYLTPIYLSTTNPLPS
jgi:tRNA threonylcarbamoyladenosine biosynthesis protein TsaB